MIDLRLTDEELLTKRVFTCESIFGDTAGYWNYGYEVPSSCWRKYTKKNTGCPKKLVKISDFYDHVF